MDTRLFYIGLFWFVVGVVVFVSTRKNLDDYKAPFSVVLLNIFSFIVAFLGAIIGSIAVYK